jgi:hypothetical protein
MRLSLASNYDPDLVARLKAYLFEIFGKLPYGLVGGAVPVVNAVFVQTACRICIVTKVME